MSHRELVRSILALGAIASLYGCAKPGTSSAASAGPAPVTATRDNTGKSLADLFQGKAGVTVYSVSGGVRLRIRGGGDFDGRGDPLFVIDGVPTEPPGGVLQMNPNDIANIEILKDDASTSIYGLRGTNGVVKITTKRK
jgi:TonB-dependent starch-binding outer membrane protein SusC